MNVEGLKAILENYEPNAWVLVKKTNGEQLVITNIESRTREIQEVKGWEKGEAIYESRDFQDLVLIVEDIKELKD